MTYYVYILTNSYGNVMYVGVTNDLVRRLWEHRCGCVEGFTRRYNVHKLVYFETTADVKEAIAREKQLKGWSRKKKDKLIGKVNPEWKDLSLEWTL